MMCKRILCFGDSNTYGFDPRSYIAERFESPIRWTGRLHAVIGWEILEHGENGRIIPYTARALQEVDHLLSQNGCLDGIVIMLGTNDLLQMRAPTAAQITHRMHVFLCRVLSNPVVCKCRTKVLLIAPPALNTSLPVSDSIPAIHAELVSRYRALAQQLEIHFADAESWHIPLACDGIHISEQGQAVFAENVAKTLCTLFPH